MGEGGFGVRPLPPLSVWTLLPRRRPATATLRRGRRGKRSWRSSSLIVFASWS